MNITKEDIIGYIEHTYPKEVKDHDSWQTRVVRNYIKHSIKINTNQIFIATDGNLGFMFTIKLNEVIGYSLYRKINNFLQY